MEPSSQISLIVLAKNLSYVAAFLLAVEYLGLSSTAISVLAVLLLVDFLTGVARAWVVDGKHTVKSSTGIRGAAAKSLVFVIPFVLAISGKGVGLDMTSLAASSITIFILSTTYSVLGNIHSIMTGHPKREIDALDYLYNQVGKMLKKIIPEDV